MTNDRGNPTHPPVIDQATYQWPRLAAGHSGRL
jgi:hypothetical protein